MDETVYLEVTVDHEKGGYFYIAYIDHDDDPIVIGSGHEDTLNGVFRQLQGLTERTL